MLTCCVFARQGPGFDGVNDSDTKSNERVLGDPGLIPRIMQSIFSQVGVLESDTMVFQVSNTQLKHGHA